MLGCSALICLNLFFKLYLPFVFFLFSCMKFPMPCVDLLHGIPVCCHLIYIFTPLKDFPSTSALHSNLLSFVIWYKCKQINGLTWILELQCITRASHLLWSPRIEIDDRFGRSQNVIRRRVLLVLSNMCLTKNLAALKTALTRTLFLRKPSVSQRLISGIICKLSLLLKRGISKSCYWNIFLNNKLVEFNWSKFYLSLIFYLFSIF